MIGDRRTIVCSRPSCHYALSMRSLCALYTFSMRSLCALYALSMRSLCILYALSMRSLCTLYALSMRSLCTLCVLSMRYICAPYALYQSDMSAPEPPLGNNTKRGNNLQSILQGAFHEWRRMRFAVSVTAWSVLELQHFFKIHYRYLPHRHHQNTNKCHHLPAIMTHYRKIYRHSHDLHCKQTLSLPALYR